VNTIAIANRADCCEGRSEGIKAYVIDQDDNEILCGSFGKAGKGETVAVTCGEEVNAKRVKIVGSHRGPINLAEVMAFGANYGISNVLFQTPAAGLKVSGNCHVGHGSGVKNANTGILTDGETNSKKGYWHSCKRGTSAFAKFNLEAPASITRVDITNRADCCEDRLTNVQVLLKNSETNKEVLCGRIGRTGRGQTARVTCDDTIKANQVIVKGGNGNLHFSEIKAWGENFNQAFPVVDCVGGWSTTETCNAGTKGYSTQTYAVTGEPKNGGLKCPFDHGATQTEECVQPVDIEFSVAETEESFTAAKQEDFAQAVADKLGIDRSQVKLSIGVKKNPISRRLSEGLIITITIEVFASEVFENLVTLESEEFSEQVATASGVTPTFEQLKPAAGSNICATCKWIDFGNGTGKIEVIHYINSQKSGEKGLQHKCYHIGDVCKCICKETAFVAGGVVSHKGHIGHNNLKKNGKVVSTPHQ